MSVESRILALQGQIAHIQSIISKIESKQSHSTSSLSSTYTPPSVLVSTTRLVSQTVTNKSASTAPQTSQQVPVQAKKSVKSTDGDGYVVDYNLIASRYIHDKYLPPVMMCDPETQYINSVTNNDNDIANAYTENERNMRILSNKLKLSSSVFYRTPDNYYDTPIQARRNLLGAPTVHVLCKSMLMTNSKCPHDNFTDPKDSKYYCAIVQYSARLHNEKLGTVIRRLWDEPRPSAKKFNFRWCTPEINDYLSGQPRNGVTPLGAAHSVPIVMSHRIAELKEGFLWLGGGEVTLKWRISIKDFIDHFNPIIGDITYDENVYDDDENNNPQ